jgi:hypothetical protein
MLTLDQAWEEAQAALFSASGSITSIKVPGTVITS